MAREGNILLVANWESGTGYAWWLMENFWVTIASHFRTKGLKSYLIYPKITGIPAAVAASDIEVNECNFHDHSTSGLRQIRRFIKQNNIRYIYLTDSPPYGPFYLLLRAWGIRKLVVHDHTPGDRTAPTGLKRLIKSAIQRTPFVTADHFIAVSDFVYKRFLDVGCIPREKCSCAPNGITPINLEKSDPRYTQRVFDIPANRTIIVTTGRASYYKRIDFFIECANELVNNKKMSQLHFLYCGDGPDLPDFEKLVQQYGLGEHFTFAGNRDDVLDILPSCHIGFHAAAGEVGYSLSTLEYMSAGLVTIVPDRPSTSAAITHLENGILYVYGDKMSAAAAICKALDDSAFTHLRKNAIELVKTKYNIEQTNKALTSILESIFPDSTPDSV